MVHTYNGMHCADVKKGMKALHILIQKDLQHILWNEKSKNMVYILLLIICLSKNHKKISWLLYYRSFLGGGGINFYCISLYIYFKPHECITHSQSLKILTLKA